MWAPSHAPSRLSAILRKCSAVIVGSATVQILPRCGALESHEVHQDVAMSAELRGNTRKRPDNAGGNQSEEARRMLRKIYGVTVWNDQKRLSSNYAFVS